MGKIAIIMTVFSIATSFGMYEVSTLYNLNGTNASWTYSNIQYMAQQYSSISNLNNGTNPNPALIFGDFLVGLTVLLNAIAVAGNAILGGGLSSVLQGIPGIDNSIILFVQIIYGSSEALLWVYVAANRSL